ncbi:hypothetical protein, partial [Pseudomonas sp.]|uniref:hypothetical protein n=1 Tax=Pseudomonas sp. TaxID=306 RepID=UPI003BB13419
MAAAHSTPGLGGDCAAVDRSRAVVATPLPRSFGRLPVNPQLHPFDGRSTGIATSRMGTHDHRPAG